MHDLTFTRKSQSMKLLKKCLSIMCQIATPLGTVKSTLEILHVAHRQMPYAMIFGDVIFAQAKQKNDKSCES